MPATRRNIRRLPEGNPMSDLVLVLIGPDRPGLVEAVAERVARHGGNWLESRMAQLAGQFTGLLRVELPADRVAALEAALRELDAQGLQVVVHGGSAAAAESRQSMDLEVVGQDHPGIVRDIARVLARHGVIIEELTTDRQPAPHGGGLLFTARARIHVPATVGADRLRHDLETIAHDLMVDLTLLQPVVAAG
jgi:glycine cleavage system regulatory protein